MNTRKTPGFELSSTECQVEAATHSPADWYPQTCGGESLHSTLAAMVAHFLRKTVDWIIRCFIELFPRSGKMSLLFFYTRKAGEEAGSRNSLQVKSIVSSDINSSRSNRLDKGVITYRYQRPIGPSINSNIADRKSTVWLVLVSLVLGVNYCKRYYLMPTHRAGTWKVNWDWWWDRLSLPIGLSLQLDIATQNFEGP